MKRFQIILIAIFLLFATSFLLLKSCSTPQDIKSTTASGQTDVFVPAFSGATQSGSALDTASGSAKTLANMIRDNDIDSCETLTSDAQKTRCKDTINMNLAMKDTSDANCNKISRDSLKTLCLTRLAKEISSNATSKKDCEKLSEGTLKEACLMKVKVANAEDINSLGDCDKIADATTKMQCQDAYYISQIRSGKSTDKALCEKIQYSSLKTECLSLSTISTGVAAGERKAEDLRAQGKIAEAAQVECSATRVGADINYCVRDQIIAEATTKQDATLCEKIPTPADVQICKTSVQKILDKAIFAKAFAAKNAALCDTIKDPSSIAACKKIITGK